MHVNYLKGENFRSFCDRLGTTKFSSWRPPICDPICKNLTQLHTLYFKKYQFQDTVAP